MLELRGKTALITGAAHRLGRACARALAEEGMNIVVHYHRSEKTAVELVSELQNGGVEALALGGDLSSETACRSVILRAEQQMGSIFSLINNASIFAPSHIGNFTRDELALNVQVNAYAPLVLSREFARLTAARVIVNFLDSRIGDYDKEHAAYHLSKRMLFSVTRMLALELAPKIRVSAVAPGLILPPPGEDEDYLESKKQTLPLESYGDTGDVAAAVRFLLASTFVTGQVIYVDGGRHMQTAVYG